MVKYITPFDDGGPAFPRPASEYTRNGTLAEGNDAICAESGMTLLHWLAGKALLAICDGMAGSAVTNYKTDRNKLVFDQRLVPLAFDVAEAMLAEYKRRRVAHKPMPMAPEPKPTAWRIIRDPSPSRSVLLQLVFWTGVQWSEDVEDAVEYTNLGTAMEAASLAGIQYDDIVPTYGCGCPSVGSRGNWSAQCPQHG